MLTRLLVICTLIVCAIIDVQGDDELLILPTEIFTINEFSVVPISPHCQSAILDSGDNDNPFSTSTIVLDWCQNDYESTTSTITECVESISSANCEYELVQSHYQGTGCNDENLESTSILSNVCINS